MIFKCDCCRRKYLIEKYDSIVNNMPILCCFCSDYISDYDKYLRLLNFWFRWYFEYKKYDCIEIIHKIEKRIDNVRTYLLHLENGG